MQDLTDQEGFPPSVPDDDLIAGVLGRRPDMDRRAALGELLRRRSPGWGAALRDVIVADSAPEELRSSAAIGLGTDATAENEAALIAALRMEQTAVLRRAAESLGRMGGERALAALQQVRIAPDTPAGRSVAFARTLLSYRLGLQVDRLQPPAPDSIVPLERERAVPVVFDSVEADAMRAAQRWLQEELPAIPIAERGSVRVSCRSERLWIVLTAEVAEPKGVAGIADRNSIPAIVLKESSCPDGWYVDTYLLAHPRDARTLDVFGVRATGVVTHFGEIAVRDTDATVRLRALNTPHALPLDLAASYSHARGGFTTIEASIAQTAGERQRRPEVPKRDVPPLEESGRRVPRR